MAGLKGAAESIDNRTDFKSFMQYFIVAKGNVGPRGPRREGLYEEGYVRLSSLAPSPRRSRPG